MVISSSSIERGLIVCVSTSALLLAGCGGGGGGGGGGSKGVSVGGSPTPTQAATITESQSQALIVSQGINGDINAAKSTIKSNIGGYENLYSQFASGSSSSACPSGGTVSVSVTDNGTPHAPDAGDSAVYTYVDCVLGDGTKTEGSITYTWVSATNDPTATDSWTAKYSQTWQNYSNITASSKITDNGTETYDITSTDAVQKSATLTFNDAKEVYYTGTPGDYVLQNTADSSGLVYTYAVDAGNNTSISLHNKRVITYIDPADSYYFDYTTATPFVFDSSNHLTGGAANVTVHATGTGLTDTFTVSNGGTSASVDVKWTVVDGSTVKLESDLDNNDSYETSYTFSFSQL